MQCSAVKLCFYYIRCLAKPVDTKALLFLDSVEQWSSNCKSWPQRGSLWPELFQLTLLQVFIMSYFKSKDF